MSEDSKNDDLEAGYRFDTRAVRAGTERTHFGEHTEAMFLTSSFVHDSAEHAAAKFAGEAEGYIYSRFGNPTVRLFENRLAALEGAEDCRATASGMSAIMSVLMSLTKTGDHVVCSQGVFGTTIQLFSLFTRYGVETSYVPLADPDAWQAAIRPNTRMLFLETPSNPLTEVADLRAIAAIAKRHGIPLVVDNCFCTPALQRPLELGADIVVHSATKYLDGQGRVIGGAVLGSGKYMNDALQPVLRYCGPTLSAFNAWMLAKGLETLSIRMQKHSENALTVARWLEMQPGVERVRYPWLESHPQHALARAQQGAGGAVLAFELAGASDAERRANAWRVVDGCRLLSITANLGDVKSTITHPASTTHGRMSPAARAEAGIGEGMLRVAVGLEDPADICEDLARGLE
ncbi:O-succinylhomoserine sulfhydrylase [Burkholderiaceae bacterium FT117]|uniref:O-succinylhomoserine sulfhydrylase n=1 Tax=Zeimonas sediminis TaxID=2944268 RepID=UPI002342D163|nr:O-succinylhomoserine sulfhydrylase [Zeimonas sediminis]MCM5569538.1 O-succinylhomoserine sulfhydrylase [Zeimonas sediminis]